MRDNRGFSLVELMVVVTMMAALIGLASFSINIRLGTEASKAIRILDMAIHQVRMDTMSKASAKIKVDVDDADQSYYVQMELDGVDQEKIWLGKPDLQISYTKKTKGSDFSAMQILDSAHPLILAFDRSTGAQKPDSMGGDSFCTEIIVRKGKTQKIILIPETGRHYVE
ncbi:MAG: type II secretion system protein [Hungatella sp.]